LKHAEFLKKFKEGLPLRAFYFFVGPERLPVDAFVQRLSERLGASPLKVWGHDATLEELGSALGGGLFGARRFTYLLWAEEAKALKDAVARLPFTPESPLVAWFSVDERRPEAYLAKRLKRPEEFFKRDAYVVRSPQLDEETFAKWVAKELNIMGIRLKRDLFAELLALLPRDLTHAKQELSKLALYGAEGITAETRREIISFTPEVSGFKAVDEAVAGRPRSLLLALLKPEEALSLLSRGLANLLWALWGVPGAVQPRWKARDYAKLSREFTPRDAAALLRRVLASVVRARRGSSSKIELLRSLLEVER